MTRLPKNLKLDGRKTIEGFTVQLKLSNKGIDKAVERLRMNQRVIAKRLLYDFRNAVNSGRGKAPCLHRHHGELCLRTSYSLIVHAEDYSFTPRTCRNNLERLEQRQVVVRKLVRLGNDVLVFLDHGILEWQETLTSPQEPPEPKGEHIEAGRARQGNGIDLGRLAERFNRKHHQR